MARKNSREQVPESSLWYFTIIVKELLRIIKIKASQRKEEHDRPREDMSAHCCNNQQI